MASRKHWFETNLVAQNGKCRKDTGMEQHYSELRVVEDQTTDNIIPHYKVPATLAAPPFLGPHELVPPGGWHCAMEQNQTERHCSSVGGRAELGFPVESVRCLLSFPWPFILQRLGCMMAHTGRGTIHMTKHAKRRRYSEAPLSRHDFTSSLLCRSACPFISVTLQPIFIPQFPKENGGY